MTRPPGETPPDLSACMPEVTALSPTSARIAVGDGARAQTTRDIEATAADGVPRAWNPLWNWADVEDDAVEDLGPVPVAEPRGAYLCETCFDAMTDFFCPAAYSPTGQDMAQCPACAVEAARRLAAEEDP